MISSKLINFGKTGLLERLGGATSPRLTIGNLEYFNVGFPISHPPTLRGSMIALFNEEFIEDNASSISFGSPIDTGGLKSGMIKTNQPLEKTINEAKCCPQKFIKILKKIHGSASSHSLSKFYKHEPTPEIIEIIRPFFSKEILEMIEKNPENPHFFIFEYCLTENYTINASHIEKIFMPNTLRPSSIIPKIAKSQKIAKFNPKYGPNYAL